MTLSKRQLLTLVLILAILFLLPVAIFVAQKRQEIRPRASQMPPALTIIDNFEGASLDRSKWNIYSNNPQIDTSSAIKQENGILRFKIPTGINQFTGLNADSSEITGDFEVTVDATIEQGGEPWGSDTYMMLHDDPWENGLFISIRKESGNKVIVKADSKIGQHVEVGRADISTTGPVTLKMKRVGDVGTWYYKVTGGDFILLATANNVYKGNGRISLGNNTWGANLPAVTSAFDNFNAKVNLLNIPTSTPTPTPSACLTLPTFDTFSAPSLDSNLWNADVGSYGSVGQTNGVLTTLITSSANNNYAGVRTKQKVCGDFEVKIDFSGFSSSGQPEGVARLEAKDYDTDTEIFIQRFTKGNEQGFWTDIKKDGVFNPGTGKIAYTSATFGKLRIRRQATVFSTYYDVGDGWKLLGSYPNGFKTNGNILVGIHSVDQRPSVSANFDNFYLSQAIPEPTFTPIPSATPTPVASPTPTPPSGREKYTIDIGDKQWLTIQVGPSINPQVRFAAKLAHTQGSPEMYLKLRVKDELAFIENPTPPTADSCNNPPEDQKDFWVPVRAEGGVYKPVPQIAGSPPAGASPAIVSPDGWVTLEGLLPGRYYTLFLKGPKTRSTKMVEHVLLQPRENQTQDFDWTGKPLDPGDLPDPNSGGRQDCTVNSIDLSLISSRLGRTDSDNLNIADVNYDGVVNSADISKVVATLSTKPDDDQ